MKALHVILVALAFGRAGSLNAVVVDRCAICGEYILASQLQEHLDFEEGEMRARLSSEKQAKEREDKLWNQKDIHLMTTGERVVYFMENVGHLLSSEGAATRISGFGAILAIAAIIRRRLRAR